MSELEQNPEREEPIPGEQDPADPAPDEAESLWEQVLAEQESEAAQDPEQPGTEDDSWLEEPEAEPQPDPQQAALDEAKAKADEYLALAQRVQADFDNYRKRNASLRADAYAEGQRSVAAQMLAVLDNIERALQSAPEDSPLKSGIELTLKQMQDVYEKLGVTPIDRVGEKFDPNLENAVLQGTPEEGEPGTVCQVLQKGYRMGSFVLRHAMVKVVAE